MESIKDTDVVRCGSCGHFAPLYEFTFIKQFVTHKGVTGHYFCGCQMPQGVNGLLDAIVRCQEQVRSIAYQEEGGSTKDPHIVLSHPDCDKVLALAESM